jgi:hypothetical protein
MKMPRRLFFPPVAPRPDVFGLHRLTLAQGGESAADRQKRVATIEAGVVAAFKAAVGHLAKTRRDDSSRACCSGPSGAGARGSHPIEITGYSGHMMSPCGTGSPSRRSPDASVPATAALSWATQPARSRPKSGNC